MLICSVSLDAHKISFKYFQTNETRDCLLAAFLESNFSVLCDGIKEQRVPHVLLIYHMRTHGYAIKIRSESFGC